MNDFTTTDFYHNTVFTNYTIYTEPTERFYVNFVIKPNNYDVVNYGLLNSLENILELQN